ncbi:MAG: branched-chain amino acid ABC transporter permease, partial [Oscillospiraceae bacterium]|nr:branched-chain amino acid ABC transporter permease [Oscillospiraceae bacterium]
MKNVRKETAITMALLIALFAATIVLDNMLPSYHIIIKVIKKASVYSLVAVSTNLLNGFTGLFSLGQAGFMLLGAYSYAILSIPVAKRAGVYQQYEGGLVQFSLPEIFSSFLGESVGTLVGMLLALLVGGLLAALFAYLIGLPVLRLKSDYLAIATLGFAEILRAFVQWRNLGPLTNGSNLLKGYPDFKGAA